MADTQKIKRTDTIKGIKFRIVPPSNLIDWQYEVKRDANQNVLSEKELRLNDITWKLTHRGKLKTFLLWLLIAQNIAVFGLVVWALWTGKIQQLQLVFSILVAATLTETVSLVYIIAKWLFTDITYQKE